MYVCMYVYSIIWYVSRISQPSSRISQPSPCCWALRVCCQTALVCVFAASFENNLQSVSVCPLIHVDQTNRYKILRNNAWHPRGGVKTGGYKRGEWGDGGRECGCWGVCGGGGGGVREQESLYMSKKYMELAPLAPLCLRNNYCADKLFCEWLECVMTNGLKVNDLWND
jgi:hypothetical protein